MRLNSSPAEYLLKFSSNLSSEDIFEGLMKAYPDELLGLKLKEIGEGDFEFKEYTTKCNHNFVSFISFLVILIVLALQ